MCKVDLVNHFVACVTFLTCVSQCTFLRLLFISCLLLKLLSQCTLTFYFINKITELSTPLIIQPISISRVAKRTLHLTGHVNVYTMLVPAKYKRSIVIQQENT